MRSALRLRSGAAAVVILTVLFLFGLILLTIYSLSLTYSKPASSANADATRALMLAHAGIQRALDELPAAASRAWQGRDAVEGEGAPGEPWTFWGEDANANGSLDGGEDVNGDGQLDAIGEPLEEALRPSFAERSGSGLTGVMVEGRPRGVSGFLRGTYAPQGDHYVLRITDAASRIWLNGPPERTRGLLGRLARRLGLPEILGARIADRAASVQAAKRLELGREPGAEEATAYRSEEDLIAVVGVDAYRRLEPYVTAWAWVDADALDVCPPERRVRAVRIGEAVSAWGDLRARGLARQPRAPVNINTAPKVVLAAVFEGVTGTWVDESARALGPSGWGIGYEWMDRPLSYSAPENAVGLLRATAPVTADEADRLANAVLAARRRAPFRTWDDFRRFLDREVRDGVVDAMQAEAIRANADPNAMLNDFNPDANAWAPIDKTDLVAGSTEFCFSSMGVFVVESLGRVLDANGRVAARRTLKACVRAYDVWRETTESEFLAAVRAGSEPEVQVAAYDGDGQTRRGLALETLPDAAPDAPADRGGIDTLWYDGRIGLATLVEPGSASTWLRASLTPPLRESLEADECRFRPSREWQNLKGEIESLSKRLEQLASRSDAESEAERGRIRDRQRALEGAVRDEERRLEREARRPRLEGEPVPGALVEAALPASPGLPANPGRLFPDGAYLERDACLAYRAIDNLPAKEGQNRSGCVSFWFKPAFDPRRASRPRTLWCVDRRGDALAPGLVEAPVFGAYLFPAPADGIASEGPYRYGFPLKGLAGFGMGQREAEGGWTVAGIATGRAEFAAIRAHAWVHLAFAWDVDKPSGQAFRMAVNGRVVPDANAFEQAAGSLPLPHRLVLAENGPGETTWISFGALGDDPRRNFALDGTVDEIRVGEASAFDDARRDALEGRYARISDPATWHARSAAFTSAPRTPASPATPGSIAWTVREAPGLPDSAVRLQFSDGRRWSREFDEPGGQPLGEAGEAPVSGEFRWRALFTTGHRPDLPANETPWLDDVTITYATRPVTLGYSTPPEK